MGRSDSSEHFDDATLMAFITKRNEKALAAFYDRYAGVVFALSLKALPRETAEEVVGDVFWELWDRADRFDPHRGGPLAYLMRMTRSRIVDKIRAREARKRKIDQAVLDEQPILRASVQQPSDLVLLSEERERVNAALSQLPDEQRATLEMAFYGAMSHSEIAQRTGEPLGTVKSRIRQGLIRIRTLLMELEK